MSGVMSFAGPADIHRCPVTRRKHIPGDAGQQNKSSLQIINSALRQWKAMCLHFILFIDFSRPIHVARSWQGRGGGVYWKFGEGRFVNCIRNLEIAFPTFLARHMSLLFALLFPIKQRKGEILMLCANTCNKYVVRYGNFDLFNHLNCSFWDITHLWKFTNAMGKSESLIRTSIYKRSVLITASRYDMDLVYSVFIITGTILYTTRLSSAMQPCQ